MKAMSLLLLGVVLVATSRVFAGNADVSPDARYAHILSPSGPLSREELLREKLPANKLAAVIESIPGPATYTYVRCFYRTSSDSTRPGTDYVWALNSSGDYYRLNGYWWSSSAFDWKNMFYSDVTQSVLQTICQNTLAMKGISQQPAKIFAANNQLSLNYTVWSNDKVGGGLAINKIVVFGDSLSDDQNIYNASQWLLPNRNSWYAGHFSNGPVWVEYLSSKLKLPLYNWAIGAAGVTVQNLVIPGVQQQVQSWQQYMQQARNYNPVTTMFAICIGANDLMSYGYTPDQVISGEQSALTNLINSGARNILLLKLPDVSRAPVFQFKAGGPILAGQIQEYNQKLEALAVQLRQQYAVNIQLFDAYTAVNDILNNPTKYHVSNTTQSCLDINTDSSLTYLHEQSPRFSCSDANTFMFWDTLHPSTYTHMLIGNEIADFLQSTQAFPMATQWQE